MDDFLAPQSQINAPVRKETPGGENCRCARGVHREGHGSALASAQENSSSMCPWRASRSHQVIVDHFGADRRRLCATRHERDP